MTHDKAIDTIRRRVMNVITTQILTLGTITQDVQDLTTEEREAIADASSDLYLAWQRLTKLLQDDNEKKKH